MRGRLWDLGDTHLLTPGASAPVSAVSFSPEGSSFWGALLPISSTGLGAPHPQPQLPSHALLSPTVAFSVWAVASCLFICSPPLSHRCHNGWTRVFFAFVRLHPCPSADIRTQGSICGTEGQRPSAYKDLNLNSVE